MNSKMVDMRDYKLIQADVLNGIPIDDKSIHCVVTSPPYFGLRDYGTEAQLGLEPLHDCLSWATGKEPVKHCCHVCNGRIWGAEIWRVLRDDGTFWLNYGDSYSGSGKGQAGKITREQSHMEGKVNIKFVGLKDKDLIGIPWRVALALQSDGWYLRSDIIWHKPNPMPESVTDRPTKSHEHIFLLTKNKKYYYDADAIKETSVDPESHKGRRKRNAHRMNEVDRKNYKFAGSVLPDGTLKNEGKEYPTRNKRDVWNMSTRSYKGAHFATFPPELPETCIKAGTSEKGVCPECGNQWERVTEKTNMVIERSERTHSKGHTRTSGKMVSPPTSKTTGWKPTCGHDRTPIPATVYDPFGGSGTTAYVAQKLGRSFILTELNPEYIELQKERTGMKALDEWENGIEAESNLEGLPMFEEINE
jgi:DNA modification methylase